MTAAPRHSSAHRGPERTNLPKTLAASDEASSIWTNCARSPKSAPNTAGAKWVKASIGGGVEFRGKQINRKWLDGWAKKPH